MRKRVKPYIAVTLAVVGFLYWLTIGPVFSASREVVMVRKPLMGATYPCREVSRDKHYKYLACPVRR